MRSVNVTIGIRPRWRDTHTVVVVRNDVLETILLTVAFQLGDHTFTLESFFGDLFKLCKQLTLQLTLQCLALPADTTYLFIHSFI